MSDIDITFMEYLSWNRKTITDFSPENVARGYEEGYVFTRIDKGVIDQTRSVRIDLAEFELTSENRRILKKTEGLNLEALKLPLTDYDWSLGKLAKDFYDTKFEPGIMSVQKVKEMLTDPEKSNFNLFLKFTGLVESKEALGYAICHTMPSFLHYSYPFYDLNKSPKDIGLGMMIRAIQYAKEAGIKYIYLGSLQRPGDVYKLQFEGLEWFDGKTWSNNLEEVKTILADL